MEIDIRTVRNQIREIVREKLSRSGTSPDNIKDLALVVDAVETLSEEDLRVFVESEIDSLLAQNASAPDKINIPAENSVTYKPRTYQYTRYGYFS